MYGYNDNQNACGVYTPGSQFVMNEQKLRTLGFTAQEIQVMVHVANSCGNVRVCDLKQMGIGDEQATKIKYLYDIASGKVCIESEQDIAKHFRKLFGVHKRIGIADLEISTVKEVPRYAVVGGITDTVYSALNSKNLSGGKGMYTVESIGTRVKLSTGNGLAIPYGYKKKVDGVVEILGKNAKDGKIWFAVDRKYCKICNRYIVVASLRVPENHHGMIKIICVEGTTLYVYAKTLGVRESVNYSGGTTRVYDYGINPNEISYKVKINAERIYRKLCGVYAAYIPANTDFQIISTDVEEIPGIVK